MKNNYKEDIRFIGDVIKEAKNRKFKRTLREVQTGYKRLLRIDKRRIRAYIAVRSLYEIIPLKHTKTRKELKRFIDFFNNEVYLK